MSEAVAMRLRQLAREYAEGNLSHESYRRMRAQSLDALVGFDSVQEHDPAVITQPRNTGSFAVAPPDKTAPAPPPAPVAPLPPPAHTPAPAPALKQEATSAPASSAPETRTRWPLIAAILVVVLGAGFALTWVMQHRAPSAEAPSAEPQAASPDTSAAHAVVQEFLDANDWSDQRVAQLNLAWKSLSEQDRSNALASDWYPEFVEATRTRLKEQRALAADEEQRVTGPLAELAASLGIDVRAPDHMVLSRSTTEATKKGSGEVAAEKTRAETSPEHAATPATAAAPPETQHRVASAAESKPAAPPAPSPAPPAAGASAASKAAPQAEKTAATAAPRSEGARSYPECSSMPVNPVRPQCRDPLGQTGFGPVIALVPAGSFAMGSDATSTEKPVHTVTISRPFGMAIYETSQAEYRAFCEATGRTFPSQSAQVDDLPVVNVSWADATAYAEWLSTASGKRYRLPTEAEWEYAARAGEKGVYAGGSQPAATDAYFSGAEKRTAPAPRSRPINKNRFWLLHMIGNVREWVQDAWSPSFDGAPADGSARNAPAGARVVRGGAYTDAASDLRLSQREKLDAGTHDARTGFRVARDSQ